ncbi:MAG: diguanylate cyclase [Candidatus Cloacimonadaceae bacterium]|jgi:diguanylate cyclase (GGDEF)-like protein/PAS domain S-box-containing protein|nr:diguanylate cyclase [Candidatus Cloacimonadota bacterium]MDY0318468.1 diguanylate cyclase [Candidatus Cloacimonadaceae bacterium]
MQSLKLESLYSTIFESTVAAIGITDLDGNYQNVNPAWCHYLGYTLQEALTLSIDDVTPPEDRVSSAANYQSLIQGVLPSLRLSRRYLRKNGSVFWADLHVSPIISAEKEIVGIVGVFVDIDRQIIAEQNLQELNAQLSLANIELQLAMQDLNRLARKDSLTHLYNRRVLMELMDKEISRASRSKQGLAVAIADLDNFKNINDTYGHETGDVALIELAKVLRSQIRTTDYVGRWGGEEFLFIFPETTCDGALIVIERVRKTVQKLQVMNGDNEIRITVSIGLSYHKEDYDSSVMIDEADQAMYRAKKMGKNRCEIYQGNC